MNTSSSGIRFIACREACVLLAYRDGQYADGTPKFSIGFGSQTQAPKLGDTISIEAAFARLKEDIAARDLILERAITVPVEQQVWDAVCSLFYQAGSRALHAVADIINEGHTVLAIGAFMRFNSGADFNPTDGHVKRRIREMAMAIDGFYGDISQVKVFDGNPREVLPRMMPFPDGV